MALCGAVFFVTGAGSGLGRAAAISLARAGSSVCVADRDADAANAVVQELGRDELSKDALFTAVTVDVADAEQVRRAIADCVQQHGRLTGIVNSAGVGFAAVTVDRDGKPLEPEVFDTVLGVNVRGTFLCASIGAASIIESLSSLQPAERDALKPVIINVASVAAYEGQKGQVAYSASKGAVVALTLPMARDLARYGIRVLCIAPGTMDTPMMTAASEAARTNLLQSIVAPKRFGKPEEFGELVVTCATNGYLNAETIRLDGGIRMANL